MTFHQHLSSSLTALALATMSAAACAGPFYDVQALPVELSARVTADGVTRYGTIDPGVGWGPLLAGVNAQGVLAGTWMPTLTADGLGTGFTYGADGTHYSEVPGHNRSELTGINATGVVVGTASNWRVNMQTEFSGSIEITDERAYTDDHGQVTVLGTLGGSWSRGQGINAKGQVVGSSATVGDGGEQAFLYSNGQMTSLGGVSSRAMAINDAGQIVGQAQSSNGTTAAFLYENGTMKSLAPAIASFGSVHSSTATLINSRGDVVVQADYEQGDIESAIYRDGVATRLQSLQVVPLSEGQPALERVMAADVNELGEVVGTSFRGLYENRATLWRNGQVTDLNDVVSMDPQKTLTFAVGIDEGSRILAMGNDQRLYWLTPSAVPEPASIALMALGLLGVAAASIRTRSLARPTSV
jgi:probable HAF family extracellular repeat protein